MDDKQAAHAIRQFVTDHAAKGRQHDPECLLIVADAVELGQAEEMRKLLQTIRAIYLAGREDEKNGVPLPEPAS